MSNRNPVNRDTRVFVAPGVMRPLSKRLSAHNQARRVEHIAARRTVATDLFRQQAMIMGAVNAIAAILKRGFFGRLKWLLGGR